MVQESSHLKDLLSQEANPFTSDHIAKTRLYWDPAVHEFYGDGCAFFLLRLQDFGPNTLREIEGWISDDLGIQSYYVFALFGHFDVMVRVWSSGTKLVNFRVHLRKLAHENVILEAKEFHVEHCDLINPDAQMQGRPQDIDIEKFVSQINAISNTFLNRHSLTFEEKLSYAQLLYDHKLLRIAISPKSDDVFRFAIAFQPDPGVENGLSPHDIQQWVLEFHDNHQTLNRTDARGSVYTGLGYAKFLLCGILGHFDDIESLTSYIRSRLHEKNMHMRMETYLTATRKSVEVDIVDPNQYALNPVHIRLAKFITSRTPLKFEECISRLRGVSKEELLELETIFSEFENSFSGKQFSSYFAHLLASKIYDNLQYLCLGLMCLPEIEGRIIQAWVEEWKSRDMGRDVLSAAQKMGLSRLDPTEPTFRNLVDISGKIKSDRGIDLLQEAIGEGWADLLSQEMADVRNDFAHGRTFTDTDYIRNNWGKLVDVIKSAGVLISRLSKD